MLVKRLRQRWMRLEKQIRPLRMLRRMFTRYNADVFVVSYPKSGRTWLRFVLGRAVQYHYQLATDKLMVLSPQLMAKVGAPRVKISHDFTARDSEGYEGTSKQGYAGKKVALLARDVRDTLVSYYYHRAKRNDDYKGTLSDFIRSDIYGATKILSFYKSWYDQQTIPAAFMMFRYEEMRQDMAAVVRQLLAFIGVEGVSDQVIAQAVSEGAFENMQQIEQQDAINFGGLKLKGQVDDPNAAKVRKGKVGGYKDELSADDLAFIERKIDEIGVPREWVYYNREKNE